LRERILKRFVALVIRGTSGHRDTAIDVTETLSTCERDIAEHDRDSRVDMTLAGQVRLEILQ